MVVCLFFLKFTFSCFGEEICGTNDLKANAKSAHFNQHRTIMMHFF